MRPRIPVGKAAATVISVLLLSGCSSGPSRSQPTHSAATHSAAQLVGALQTYASAPCSLLSDAEMAAYRITVGPRLLDGLYGGTHRACYWVTSGRQLGWFPDPPPYVRDQDMKKAGAQRLTIAGQPAVQVSDKDTCVQDIGLDTDHYFRSVTIRVKGGAPGELCPLTSAFSGMIMKKFRS
jgi:hypothetical protein